MNTDAAHHSGKAHSTHAIGTGAPCSRHAAHTRKFSDNHKNNTGLTIEIYKRRVPPEVARQWGTQHTYKHTRVDPPAKLENDRKNSRRLDPPAKFENDRKNSRRLDPPAKLEYDRKIAGG